MSCQIPANSCWPRRSRIAFGLASRKRARPRSMVVESAGLAGGQHAPKARPLPAFSGWIDGGGSSMANDNKRKSDSDDAQRESGQPGGGAGRRDEVGRSGVYPMSGGLPTGKHVEIRTPGAWGQGDRGGEGY